MQNSRKKYKRQIVIVLFFILSPIVMIGGFNLVVDPLQIYRKYSFGEPKFWRNQRYQNAGKINSYLMQDGYDAIIIGHSQTDNFIPSMVAKNLGWRKVMKLTIDGATPREQFIMVENAIKKGKVKHVLWGIGNNFLKKKHSAFNSNHHFPIFLYTDSIIDDYQYLLSIDIYEFSRKLLCGNSRWKNNIETLNYWMPSQIKNYYTYSNANNLKTLNEKVALNMENFKKASKDERKHFPNIETNLMPLIRNNPDVDFVIFFAPLYPFVHIKKPKQYRAWIAFQKTVVTATENCKNVKIYGFDDCRVITGNAANFRDVMHYHSGVNLFMLNAFKTGAHRLSVSNFDRYEKTIDTQLSSFKVYSDFEKMIPMALKGENESFLNHISNKKYKTIKKEYEAAKKLFQNKKYDQAIQEFQSIVSEPTSDAKIISSSYYFLGIAYKKTNNHIQALYAFNQSIELQPSFPWAYPERGLLHLKEANYDDAIRDFKKMISLKPNRFRGYRLLGTAYFLTGDNKNAIGQFTKAIELAPKRHELYIERAKVYTKMGKTLLSRKDYKSAKNYKTSLKIP